MDDNRLGKYAGNKFSLRAKSIQMVKRIEGISSHLGALGDFLVTTWLGILLSIVVFFIGAIIFWFTISANNWDTLKQNILPASCVLVATLLMALNTVLTNPSKGLQILVSFRFLNEKINGGSRKSWQPFRIFKFYKNDESLSTIEVLQKRNRIKYLAVYQTRGTVSPVAFDSELEFATMANRQLLTNMERDTTTTKVVSIETTKVHRKQLPENATEGMMKRRDLLYNVTNNRPSNQQLKTTFFVCSPTPEILRVRTNSVEASFNRGLVVGYKKLKGKEAINAIKKIYGK